MHNVSIRHSYCYIIPYYKLGYYRGLCMLFGGIKIYLKVIILLYDLYHLALKFLYHMPISFMLAERETNNKGVFMILYTLTIVLTLAIQIIIFKTNAPTDND